MLIILDLDETLIHSSTEWVGRSYDFIAGNRKVYIRPYLTPLLEYISGRFNIGIWTASYGNYTKEVLNNIIPNSVCLDFIRDRSHCKRVTTESADYFTKDVKSFNHPSIESKQYKFIDDFPERLIADPSQIIPVKPYFGSTEDNELLEIIEILQNV